MTINTILYKMNINPIYNIITVYYLKLNER